MRPAGCSSAQVIRHDPHFCYLTSGDRLRFGPVECVFHARTGIFAPARANSGRTETGNKTVLVGVVAFVVTIVVLFAIYKFVM